MQIRLREEAWESDNLSPYAARSGLSGGRLRSEEECDIRTAYQRDRDRVLHSKAFRRLSGKTQVFIAPTGDHYRTRLTHTLEVAQIARTVARALRLNEALTEAIALGHDLGHTPFGHAGESVLNQILPGFRHNEQSLRVVDELEGDGGLNLTFEVRNGILCHTGDEAPLTLEGQVVKICDRIAYINHDIDDSVRGGLLTEEQLPAHCLEVLGKGRTKRIDTMVTDLVNNSLGQPEVKMSASVQNATLQLREFLFERVYLIPEAQQEKVKICRLISSLFEYYYGKPECLPIRWSGKSQSDLKRHIADYIAGMTDRYVLNEYEELFLPKAWSR